VPRGAGDKKRPLPYGRGSLKIGIEECFRCFGVFLWEFRCRVWLRCVGHSRGRRGRSGRVGAFGLLCGRHPMRLRCGLLGGLFRRRRRGGRGCRVGCSRRDQPLSRSGRRWCCPGPMLGRGTVRRGGRRLGGLRASSWWMSRRFGRWRLGRRAWCA